MAREQWRRLLGAGFGARLVRGAGMFLGIQVVGVGLMLLSQVVLARVLGAQSFGIYTVAQSWIQVLLVGCQLGLVTGALRFVPEYMATRRLDLLRGFVLTSQSLVLGGSIAVAVGASLAVFGVRHWISNELAVTLWVGSMSLPCLALLQLSSATLRGLKCVSMSQIPVSIIQTIVVIGGVGSLAAVAGEPFGAPRAALISAIAVAVALAVSTVWLIREVPSELWEAETTCDRAGWKKAAVPLLLINGVNVLHQRADVLVIGSLVNVTEAGLYAAASRISYLIPFGLLAVNAWAAPYFAEFYANGRRSELQRVVRISSVAILVFTLPIAAATVALGRPALGLFGSGFEGAYVSLVVLTIGQLVNALTGPVVTMMTMTGHQGEAFRILGINSVANLVLNVTLVPYLGITGAAVASALTQATRNVWMAVVVWRRLGIRTTPF